MGIPIAHRRPHVPGQRPAHAPAGAETGWAAPHPIPRSPSHLRDDGAPEWRGRENGVLHAGALFRGLHAGHLRPRHNGRPAQSRPDDGEHPLPCRLMVSATRPVGVSVWVRKKRYPKNGTYEKQKSSKSDDFEDFWQVTSIRIF